MVRMDLQDFSVYDEMEPPRPGTIDEDAFSTSDQRGRILVHQTCQDFGGKELNLILSEFWQETYC